MSSKANHHRGINGGESGEVSHLCSINLSGLVFVCGQKFTVSSELALSVQIIASEREEDWNVRGLVVECRAVKRGRHARYQVTLLFSELPDGLGEMVAGAMIAAGSFMQMKGCPLFGLN